MATILLVFENQAQSSKKTGLSFDQTTYNFGDVEQWNNQPAIFNFTNNSNSSLVILPLFPENDLQVVIPNKPILPGESIQIKAMYYTDGKGAFSRSFPIYFGSIATPITLKITGNIKSLSPDAYIQCPTSRPEQAKAKMDLVGDVADLKTELALSNVSVEIMNLQGKKEVSLVSNSRGIFGTKLSIGNYLVQINQPGYQPYSNTFYFGQNAAPLKIRLTPIPFKESELLVKQDKEEIEFAYEPDVSKTPKEKENIVFAEETIVAKPPKENAIKEEPTAVKENQVVIDKVVSEEYIIPKNIYTFRVLDKKTLEPIKNATINIVDLFNKNNKHSDKTNLTGYSSMQIEPADYKFTAFADSYTSSEIRISKADKSEVFNIYLNPAADLYQEIYEANKEKNTKEDELLSQLSFGKKDFSFAEEEKEEIAENIEETPILDNKIEEKLLAENKTPEPIVIEKVVFDKAKEDSLQRIISDLEAANKREQDLKNDNLRKQTELATLREKETIDSLNNYINELLAKNEAIKTNLEKVAEDKALLEAEKNRETEKLEELIAKNKEIAEVEIEDPFSSKKYQANNIMFLIDISTSMAKANKMEMLKTSIKSLVGILRDIDRVAIITYNQQTNIVLESISGDNKEEILSAIDNLQTGGLTNGVKGITTAYDVLKYYYIPNGNNQIILATDGLFSKDNNAMSENDLNKLVKKQAAANMKLTIVGFGKDEKGKPLMEKLAKNGMGQFIQITDDYQTRDVLIKEIKLNSEIKE